MMVSPHRAQSGLSQEGNLAINVKTVRTRGSMDGIFNNFHPCTEYYDRFRGKKNTLLKNSTFHGEKMKTFNLAGPNLKILFMIIASQA